MTTTEADLTAADVTWDLEPLLDGADNPDELIERAKIIADDIEASRGTVATMGAEDLAALMHKLADINELMSRAGHYGMLKFTENTADPERGALMQSLEAVSYTHLTLPTTPYV